MKWKTFSTFGSDEPIVSMVEYQGEIFVATSRRVFRKPSGEDKFYVLIFASPEHGMAMEVEVPMTARRT